ncbi:BapA prefix-like domain-containing protein, partial [Halomonas halmophila]|uniref:BapA prefix-like domain-containing protein n=1 Tax=Halomonas halmophila TaxID=252 RepID=UPI0011420B52
MKVKTSTLAENIAEQPIQEVANGISLEAPSRVALDLAPEQVASMVREGNDLIIETTDGRTFRITDFYTSPPTEAPSEGGTQGQSELYLDSEEGELIRADLSPQGPDGIVQPTYMSMAEPAFFEGEDTAAGLGITPITVLGGLAATGGVAAIAGGDGGDGGSDTGDDGGGTDNTAPEAPILNLATNEDGNLTVSGEAEPGSDVTVTLPDGSTVETSAGENGSFEVTSPGAQPSGEVSATATDEAGNTSEPATQDYVAPNDNTA